MQLDSPNTRPRATLDEALAIMRDLRTRDAWDAAQTHASLRPYLNEEAHELDEAIRVGDDRAMCAELGDVLLQVFFHAIIAEERGAFDIHDVAGSLVNKMRVRHPALFGAEGEGAQPGAERESWEGMKARTRRSLAEGLPPGLPALHRAHRLQERAAGIGFDWPDATGPVAKVREELSEAEAALASGTGVRTHGVPEADPRHAAIEAELGDLLFAVVNLCRKCDVHPALALDRANAAFQQRFERMERLAAERGIEMRSAGLALLDSLWDAAKRDERAGSVEP